VNIVLNNWVEASEKSAAALEMMRDGERLSFRVDVEALMEQVVDILCHLNAHVERWQSAIAGGPVTYDEATARALHELYGRLEATALKTAQLGRRVEGWGLELRGKVAFLAAWRELKAIASFSLERFADSLAQIRRGDAKTLGDFADELSRESIIHNSCRV